MLDPEFLELLLDLLMLELLFLELLGLFTLELLLLLLELGLTYSELERVCLLLFAGV